MLYTLIQRNIKLFFKDKGLFFTSLITPMILLVLYATFLGNVYRDAFAASIPPTLGMSERMIDGAVAGQLVSSLLAVSCVTVSFCSNMLMVNDKISGARRDMLLTRLRPRTLATSYCLATMASSLLICLIATVAGLGYIAVCGWYFSVTDILLLLLDVVILVGFGTVLSSVVNFFLSSQGQISAVGTVISSCYGFICGAYMPISQFPVGLQKVVSFLPGTYGTSLLRSHAMNGVFHQMEEEGIPAQLITEMRDAVDCNLYFMEHSVSDVAKLIVLVGSVLLLGAIYVTMNVVSSKRRKNGY